MHVSVLDGVHMYIEIISRAEGILYSIYVRYYTVLL